MIKKLSKYGNSLAVLLDKPILELLNITDQTEIRISTDGNKIILEPIRLLEQSEPISTHSKTQASYEKITEKYQRALKKLK